MFRFCFINVVVLVNVVIRVSVVVSSRLNRDSCVVLTMQSYDEYVTAVAGFGQKLDD